MADALELEESELFDTPGDLGQPESLALDEDATLPSPATIFPNGTLDDEAGPDEDDEALDLELDSDSPASSTLAMQMASLQSSAGRSDPIGMEGEEQFCCPDSCALLRLPPPRFSSPFPSPAHIAPLSSCCSRHPRRGAGLR